MDSLIGLWSVGALESREAGDNTAIVFLADGAGWIEYWKTRLLELETFRWKADAAGKLQLHGVVSYTWQGEEKPSELRLRDVQVAIGRSTVQSGGEIDMITFDRPVWGKEMRFGLVRKDAAREQFPSFEEREAEKERSGWSR
ncbi:hypothetical protein [Paenibacillus ginsengarvi]|uniref:Uncharacterized protein n=1 Tax=Paenibacillus ginsengarvi TaxID=400777 RepID=A0A3B0CGA3_9BACL|nr:hypothetical protein [Paenibacillus ginsengarvi]RKN84230.1 hypothetical protein D7M11_14600 [Paenibacillus ginsengarvi]